MEKVKPEEIANRIYRIPVPLKNNPLRYINSYLIMDAERELLIDTGFRTRECHEALESGLKYLGSARDKRDVLITHYHSDHAGLADVMAAPQGRIYMSEAEVQYNINQNRVRNGSRFNSLIERFIEEGFVRDNISQLLESDSDNMKMPVLADRLYVLKPHERISYGTYKLESIPAPGHTPGNTMLWEANTGVMFTGDHVLFDVSPNITAYMDVDDSLGDYISSLESALQYPVRKALPGHRESGDYHARIEQLILHHEKRLNQVMQIVESSPGLCAYDITSRMRWKIRAKSWEDFPNAQKWFAMGECLAHLDHLLIKGALERRDEAGSVRYYPKPDDTRL